MTWTDHRCLWSGLQKSCALQPSEAAYIFIPNHPTAALSFISDSCIYEGFGLRIPHINKTLTKCSLIAWSLIFGTSVSCALCYCFHPVRFSHGLRTCRGATVRGSHFSLSLALSLNLVLLWKNLFNFAENTKTPQFPNYLSSGRVEFDCVFSYFWTRTDGLHTSGLSSASAYHFPRISNMQRKASFH